MKAKLLICVALVCSLLTLHGQKLKLASIFTDNMVLQQKTETPVWGWAKSGTSISITPSWSGQSYKATADKQGKWMVKIQTPNAGGPYKVEIDGTEKIVIDDVLIGEVWLASGQSNMSMPLKGYYCQPVAGSNEAILNSAGKQIRFINIPARGTYKPQEEFKGEWKKASLENTAECSAVAWFFADFINKKH